MSEEKKPSLEETFAEIETIIEELESGELDLDKSIGKYERAVVLRDRCKKILEESERRVRKITETPEGTEISDFSAD